MARSSSYKFKEYRKLRARAKGKNYFKYPESIKNKLKDAGIRIDRRSNGPAVMAFSYARAHLSQEELDTIYNIMVDIDFFSFPRFYNPILGEIIGAGTPFSIYYLEYINETGTKIVQWDNKYSPTTDTGYNNLKELAKFIIRIIQDKPEYKELPKPTGGYA